MIFPMKEKRMLQKMRKTKSEADLASSLKVSVSTIRRWTLADDTPPYAVRVLIARIFKEYSK